MIKLRSRILTDMLVRLQIPSPECVASFNPSRHSNVLEMHHPDVHHLSMPLLNKDHQLSFHNERSPRKVQILGELYGHPCRVYFQYCKLRCYKVVGSEAYKECIQIRRDQVKPTSLFRIVQRGAIFSQEGVKQATNKLPPFPPKAPFNDPISKPESSNQRENSKRMSGWSPLAVSTKI